MQYLVLISVLALSLKLLALWNIKGLIKKASPFALAIAIAFLVMNVCELCGFYFASREGGGLPILITYYAAAVLAAFSMFALALQTTRLRTKHWLIPLAILFCIIEATLIVPGAAIAGIESIGYSATRIPGPLYIVVQVGMLLPLGSMFGLLLFTLFNSKRRESVTKAKVYLFSFSPLAVVMILVIILMALGLKVNASGFISLTVCLTMWVLLFASNEKNQYLFLSFIPNTREHRSVYSIATNLASPDNGLKQALLELESRIIEETLAKTDGNITHASEILGIGRSTLSQKVTKFGIGGNYREA